MDYGGYRDRYAAQSSSGYAVTTITTGIPLSKRFEILEHSKINSFASEGYGLRPAAAANPFAGRGRGRGLPVRAYNRANQIPDRELALRLARKDKSALANPQAQRLRVPVQARLGTSRGALRGLRGRGMVGRRGLPVARGRGGGPVLNRVQKATGSITRRGGPVRGGRGSGRGQAAGARGVGSVQGQNRGKSANVRGGRGGRGGAGRGRGGANKKVSKDDLDSELDSYMAKTKGYLDRELDSYMSQVRASQAAVSSGALPGNDGDVTMTDA